MVEALASPIISNLLKEGFSYLGIGVSTNLRDLETTILPQFQLVIKAAERSNERKSELEQWVRRFKDALYEAEDVVDLYKYQLLKEKVSNLNTHPALRPFKKVAQKVNTRLSILSPQKIKLKKCLNNLEKIAAEARTFREFLGMQIGDGTTSHDLENGGRPNVTTSTPPIQVFGREEDRDEIIKYLLDQSEASGSRKCYSVITIVGIGGAGKTTLAQLVYNDQRVINHFDIKMWVCISRKLDIFRHTREMVEFASRKECPRLENLDMLQNTLKDLIQSKKVLLILDDIWCDKTVNGEEWETLLTPLNVGERGSKILVTTRTQNLPMALHPQYSLSLRDLEENAITSLFMYHAFLGAKFSDLNLQKELEDIGKQIVQKLYRSPLAAKAVGGQLRTNLEANFWRDALRQNNLHDTQQALLWSYQRLNAPLQLCFSYFSLFPKGTIYKAKEMIHMWMAEGFINSSKNSKPTEDIGMDYFGKLVSGSFLQHAENINIEYYYMHDLFHDLAERISEEDCLRIEDDQVKEIPVTIRRLNISSESIRINSMSFNNLENLHTLIFHGSRIDDIDYVTMAIRKFKKLRVLKIHDLSIQTLPKSIEDLKHLRYLNLYWTRVAELTMVVGKLYHLQVLITPRATTLAKTLKNLINLRHFEGDDEALTRIPYIGRRLTSLQTLPKFYVRKEKGYDIGQLRNLKELRGSLSIWNLENIKGKDKAIEANLKDQKNLDSLELKWDYRDERECRRDLDREVLEGLQPHPNLTKLCIKGYKSPGFPSWLPLQDLRFLEFETCTALEVLPPMSDLFPHCRSLRISSLPNLRKFPLLPSSLKELKISHCPSIVFVSKEETEERVEDISEGKEKIELILPSALQSLKISYCDITDGALSQSIERLTSLKSLMLKKISTITTLPYAEVLHHLVALNNLKISLCSRLKSVGGLYALPSLEELSFWGCDCLELEMVMPAGEGGGRATLPPSLRELRISNCNSMKSFVVAARDLSNLNILVLTNCPSLASLSLSRLTALTRLNISWCPSLASLSLSLLISLMFLEVRGCPKLSSLPSNLLESLTELCLVSCPAISSLSNLPESLEELHLGDCDGILSLPDLPESLKRIHIWSCPVLQERCRSPDGEDWPKIAPIPDRDIGEYQGFIHGVTMLGPFSLTNVATFMGYQRLMFREAVE